MRTLLIVAAGLWFVSPVFAEPGSGNQVPKWAEPAAREEARALWEEARERFIEQYAPATGAAVRLVSPPWTDERRAFCGQFCPSMLEVSPPDGPGVFLIRFPLNESPKPWYIAAGGNDDGYHALQVASNLLNVGYFRVAGPDRILLKKFPGDWTADSDADEATQMAGLARVLSEQSGERWEFVPATTLQKSIILRGAPTMVSADREFNVVLPGDGLKAYQFGGGKMIDLARGLSRDTRWPVFVETTADLPEKARVWVELEGTEGVETDGREQATEEVVRGVMDAFARQTGLEWTIEERPVTVYTLTRR